MHCIHHSRNSKYRHPFGARPAGSRLSLCLEIQEAEQDIDFVLLHYAYGLERFDEGCLMLRPSSYAQQGRFRQSLTEAGLAQPGVYGANLALPGDAGLFFYWFEIRFCDRSRLYVHAYAHSWDGAAVSDQAPRVHSGGIEGPEPFQVTLYCRDFRVPAWFAGRLMYQIFPDRFARSRDFHPEDLHRVPHREAERIFHESWAEDVDIEGRPETGYLACDFYGGSLRGIEEHLDHLEKLGVHVLYLNPIFEARSNHRYDTADYMRIDPLLGTEEDFCRLVKAAEARGISLVLDGVFSHTGADSVYFNKYGNYPGRGAYQAAVEKSASDYYGWYRIYGAKENYRYDCWWGFEELPAVNENDLSFRDYILGEQGVIRYWLRRGARGFRLDVSDELPDNFLRSLRRSVKYQDRDAVIMGEVWEDASKKLSYGQFRDFLFGRSHDCVMGYPFRQALLDFFREEQSAEQLCERLEAIREQYPPMAYAADMHLLSSHDVPRFITAVAGDPMPETREAQGRLRLTPEQRRLGRRRQGLAYALTLLFPGSPAIYYGDERLVEGYRDPFNRRTFPWESLPWSDQAKGIEEELAALSQLRSSRRVLELGQIQWLAAQGRCLAFRRHFVRGRDLLGRPVEATERDDEVLVLLNSGSETWVYGDRQVAAYTVEAWSGSECLLRQHYGD